MKKTTHTRYKIAKDWIDLHCLPEGSEAREPLFWSYEVLSELIESDPEEAWAIIDTIRQLNRTDIILANLAAGPLEDLLVSHGDKFIQRFEVLAQIDEPFRKLLGGTWQNDMPDALWTRIKSIADSE